MNELIVSIKAQLAQNEFLSGGLLLGFAATVLHQLRSLPIKIYHWVLRRFTVEVDIPDRDEAFIWIDKWLSAHTYSRNWARDLTVRTERPSTGGLTSSEEPTPGDDDGIDETMSRNQQPRIILSPAPGRHLFFFKRRLVSLYRERKDGSEEGKMSFGIRESFVLRIFARNRRVALDLLEEARELVHPVEQRKVTILTEQYQSWSPVSHQRIRPIESVILPEGHMESLIETIKQFKGREDWYFDRGIPWRMGILLYGPPGGGKSSTVIALASHFDMDIALLNLNGFTSSDETLRSMMSRLPANTIVLLEDVDCIGIQRKRTDRGNNEKISFSGFLNAIDGVAASEGRILFMTTNHVEKLDSALIRPGRADVKMEIGAPTPKQRQRLFLRFYPDAAPEQVTKFVKNCKLKSMASIQGHLLANHSSEEATCNLNSTKARAST